MTVTPETLASEAVSRMLGQKVGALPVVEDGRLVGILTRTDILRAFLRLQAEVPVTV
jgi:CBS domain-containing protein